MNKGKGGFCNKTKCRKLTLNLSSYNSTNEITVYFPMLPTTTGLLNVRAIDEEGVTHVFSTITSKVINVGEIHETVVTHIATLSNTEHPYVVINGRVWAKCNMGASAYFELGKKCVYDIRNDSIKRFWGDEWELPSEADWRNLFAGSRKQIKYIGGHKGVMIENYYTGASIFFPTNDWFLDYWTSDDYDGNNNGNSSHAYAVGLNSENEDVHYMYSSIYLNSQLYRRLIHRLDR
jgi:hypothetical protein